jgi:hypothetical protein
MKSLILFIAFISSLTVSLLAMAYGGPEWNSVQQERMLEQAKEAIENSKSARKMESGREIAGESAESLEEQQKWKADFNAIFEE